MRVTSVIYTRGGEKGMEDRGLVKKWVHSYIETEIPSSLTTYTNSINP